MNPFLLDRYIAATARKRSLEQDLRETQDDLNSLEPLLLEEMLALGVQSVKASGGAQVYLHRQLWASPEEGNYDRACDALRAAGLDDFIQRRFNTNTLSAYVRELDAHSDPLPAAFGGAIKVSEKTSVRVRGA